MKLPTKLLEDAVNEISKLPGIGKNGIKTFPVSPKKKRKILLKTYQNQ